jgi:DNA modification methylase
VTEPKAVIHNRDCIQGIAELIADDSVHLTVTSIPFEELFTYSGKLEDVGNNGSTIDIRKGRFALNMRFVVSQLLRVTAPGCNVCIHIQQLLAYKIQHGFMGRRDFRGAMIDVFSAEGFLFVGEVAIPKDPQQMAQRLNLHSLQFKTGYARTSTALAPAPNDYVLIFQKPGEPVAPVRAIRHSQRNPSGWITTEDWIKWAHGCWNDILQTDILDGWRSARETDEEKHVCPLQLSLIYRLVQLYTNPISVQPDVLVLDPFMGIGSTAWVCVGGESHDGRIEAEKGFGRNVVGFELKESYHDQAIRNVAKARAIANEAAPRPARSLFDSGDENEPAVAGVATAIDRYADL